MRDELLRVTFVQVDVLGNYSRVYSAAFSTTTMASPVGANVTVPGYCPGQFATLPTQAPPAPEAEQSGTGSLPASVRAPRRPFFPACAHEGGRMAPLCAL